MWNKFLSLQIPFFSNIKINIENKIKNSFIHIYFNILK
jgi:hypothetical protein